MAQPVPSPNATTGGKKPLDHAIALARTGAWAEARAALLERLAGKPDDADAWFWFACLAENPWDIYTSLERAAELRPDYPGACRGMAWAKEQIAAGRLVTPLQAPFVPAPPAAPTPVVRQESRHWWPMLSAVLVLLVLAAVGFALRGSLQAESADRTPTPHSPANEPTAMLQTSSWEEAWAAGDWVSAVRLLSGHYAQEPDNPLWRDRLFESHMRLGQKLAETGSLDLALKQYDAAMALRPYDTELQMARGAAERYVQGAERMQAGDWADAIDILTKLEMEFGAFRNTSELLYSAWLNLGIAQQAAGEVKQAEISYNNALRYDGDTIEVESQLQQLDRILHPPSPTPTFKRIEVSISQQRLWAYDHEQVVYDMICSTGSDISPTAPGEYQILDKLPMAYASTWNLQMPFWMGIYWSGTLENGIHALPILSNGEILWDGYLGQRVSFGCVILSSEDAETLYNWAETGVPVQITL